MNKWKATILVVDDEPSIRELFIDYLGFKGYRVLTADNGKTGIEVFERETCDLIFLDVHMPVMNGFEALKQIRQISLQQPVIIMDSYPDLLLEQAEELGVAMSIHKPFSINELMEAIMATITLHA